MTCCLYVDSWTKRNNSRNSAYQQTLRNFPMTLDQQETDTFSFKKDGGQTITNYCSEIFKREKHKFYPLKSSRGTDKIILYKTEILGVLQYVSQYRFSISQ